MVKRWSSGKLTIGLEDDDEVDGGDEFLVESAAIRGNRRTDLIVGEIIGNDCCIVTVSRLLYGKNK